MTLQVIGAGFGRTGTMSLKLALEQLGLGPCHHMAEVFAHPETIPLWTAAADGQADWDRIFQGYRSAVDWPTATFYEELAARYPDAKVILTEREPESWFRSTQATIFAHDFPEATDDPWTVMVGKVVSDLFERKLHDRAKVLAVYHAHNARVREVIPPERLLVYEVAQGWGPLCEFLGVAAPEGAMPKVNSTEEFQQRLAHQLESRAEPAAAGA
jgi:hypothetical protein